MKSKLSFPFTWLATASFLMAVSQVAAQSPKVDTSFAARRRTFEQPVFRDQVRPNWLNDSLFWYRIQTGKQRHQFVLVNAAAGTRAPLFDHQQMATALSQHLSRPFSADALPLEGVVMEAERNSLRFSVNRQRLRCDCNSYRLENIPGTDAEAASLSVLKDIPQSSRSSDVDTEIVLINESTETVRLFWRSLNGKRVPYANVEAGKEHRQHTFAGHVWEVTDLEGRPLAGFVATEEPSRAVITSDLQPIEDMPSPNAGTSSGRSPDGRWAVIFRNHNATLQALEETMDPPAEWLLTTDGTSDDAYAGEVYWSPNSKQFVVLQTRAPQRHTIHLIESSPDDQLQPRLHSYEYLKPGDQIPQPRPQLFDVELKQRLPVSAELFPSPWSISEIRWDSDSQRFTFLYNQRGHQVLRLIAVDRTGQTTTVINEVSPTFIDYNSKLFLRHLDTQREILWMSERDGWNHLWLYDANTGKVKQQITQGEYVVHRIDHVDESKRQVWFLAGGVKSSQDPYYLHLCRVNFDGSGFVVLTEGDGSHEVTFSPDRQWFLDKWSRVDQPPTTELRRSDDGQSICVLERADHQALLDAGWMPPERFVTAGRDGKTPIYGIIIRPANFDPAKQYPVVEQIYAGPHGAHVPKAFSTLSRQQAMAALGFVIVQIDGMGTNWRSKEFHNVCWQNLADAGFPDRIAWIKEAARTRPWMDLSRVGIYGGSAGGQNAMRALIDHHDFYHVAVADCGCHDNRMDKIWWNELWMGYPVGAHYDASSNTVHAHKLQGQLMLIVGELDRNVDPASTMQVVGALQAADIDFDLVVIAGAGHGAAETPYGSRRRENFLVRHLLRTSSNGLKQEQGKP